MTDWHTNKRLIEIEERLDKIEHHLGLPKKTYDMLAGLARIESMVKDLILRLPPHESNT